MVIGNPKAQEHAAVEVQAAAAPQPQAELVGGVAPAAPQPHPPAAGPAVLALDNLGAKGVNVFRYSPTAMLTKLYIVQTALDKAVAPRQQELVLLLAIHVLTTMVPCVTQ